MGQENLYEEDWKDEAPFLASLDKNIEIDVPDDYFEGLSEKVLAQIRKLPSQNLDSIEVMQMVPQTVISTPTVGFRRGLFWGIAAGIVLLVSVGTYFLMNSRDVAIDSAYATKEIDAETMKQLASLETSEVVAQLDVSHLSDEQLFAALGKEEGKAFDEENHGVGQDEAYEYLKNVDLDQLDLQDLDLEGYDLESLN